MKRLLITVWCFVASFSDAFTTPPRTTSTSTSTSTTTTAWTNNQRQSHQRRLYVHNVRDPPATWKNATYGESEQVEESELSSSDIQHLENTVLQSFDDDASSPAPPQPKIEPKGIAIVLNINARGVTPKVVKRVQQLLEETGSQKGTNFNRVYVTSTQEEAKLAALDIVERPPVMVIPVGGDGTLTTLIQYLWDVLGDTSDFPMFGYIPRGTGNALGTVIGCSLPRPSIVSRIKQRFSQKNSQPAAHQRPLESTIQKLFDLSQTFEQEDSKAFENVDIVDLPLLQVTTTTTTTTTSNNQKSTASSSHLCFFAGVGFDSLMLQDYHDLQQWSTGTIWKNRLKSVFGYCVTLVTRTLPKCIQRQAHLVHVTLTTPHPESTVWVDHRRGDVVRPVGDHTLLYEGQAGIVAAATTPFYGGGLRLFPFARMTQNTMHLRIGRIHPWKGVVNIPDIFRGSYRDTTDDFGCLDFLSTHFSLELQDDYPVQHSGESIGHCQKVDFQVVPTPMRFVTLLPPRLVREKDEDKDAVAP